MIVTSEAEKIKRLVAHYVRKYETTDPFELADKLGVLYQIGNCKHEGCYMFLKNHRYIFLSNGLNEADRRIVMAHELGHSILDRKVNSYFIRSKTFLLNSRIERRANIFAAHLLIADEALQENINLTVDQLSRLLGFNNALIELRLKDFKVI